MEDGCKAEYIALLVRWIPPEAFRARVVSRQYRPERPINLLLHEGGHVGEANELHASIAPNIGDQNGAR